MDVTNRIRITLTAIPFVALTILTAQAAVGQTTRSEPASGDTRVPVVFNGGYETDPRDRGRPVVLVAAGLGVPSEVFRAAFRNVRPAGPGQQPEQGQVRQNKAALMSALGRYGVTNERLDEVSNFYRYRGDRGELWRHHAAAGYATVKNGAVTGFTVTDPGYGYSSTPTVTVPGYEKASVKATVTYVTDLQRNGSISGLALAGR